MADQPDLLCFDMPKEAGLRGVIITDSASRIQFIDSRICDLLGVEASDLTGKSIVDVAKNTLGSRFVDPEDFERRYVQLCENPSATIEDVMELATPVRRVLHRYSTPLLDEANQPVARVDVYSDITKRRQLENANITLYKQICAAFEELKTTQDQLVQSEKLRAIGEIASGVAHDFNNTLGIVLGNIQLLLRSASDEKSCSRLRAIEQATLDGMETVRRIREFTCLLPDAPMGTVDLSLLVSSVLGVMQAGWQISMQADDRRVEFDCNLGQDVLATGVAAEIREVLTNIFLNAYQAMPDGGTMHVETGKSSGYAWAKITDTGIGMDEDVMKRVFDPFFTTKGVEGTGLGMSVAYGIVKRHNGKISISSRPGEGTTVTIYLNEATDEAQKPILQKTPELPAATPIRALIVDDEAAFAQVFMEMLTECGHTACVAATGQEALDRFKAEPFDLVFTDLGMPEMSGWQVAGGIKDIRPSTPVVLLTGWGAEVGEEQIAGSSVDMVLSKPVKMEDLSGLVALAINKSKCQPKRF